MPLVVNVSRVDLNLFVVLDAIYTEGGITRASERLNLTQPAISHALARLRELVDDPLFVREGHAMVPTPAAHALIGPVRRALKEIEGSLNRLKQFDPATSTRAFRIGMRHIVESATLPALAQRLRAQAPHVQIVSAHHDRDALHGALATGELDAVIDVLLPRVQHVSYQLLAGGRMVVAVRAGHPRVGDTLDLATYLEVEHVMTSSRRSGPGLEDLALQRLGHERRVAVRCQHHWTACQLVASSDLLLTMPERYAGSANAALGNRLLPFPLATPANDLYLYWHANADAEPGNRWLREQIRNCLADHEPAESA
ncbi:LysR family transcriptional regulator [Rhizobacter sp. Root404]|uniref:LysR family transcriptional regulator n=1 Tax=Rhizobacter sp. Root404 TaxID=1736528 RepID=UPI0006FC246E|nr:LysR family transcriptional regulator [Rhizobacter sp. Root404]KQW40121.1 LysR family transcriptional regulator [Rhizobacter sp. Root404]